MIIPHNQPTLGDEEISAAKRVLESGWVAQGKEVAGFEDEFCAFLGLPAGHAVAVSSGSSALYMALYVCGAAGKSVLQPAYACAAIRNASVLCGSKPLFADNAYGDPNVDRASLQEINIVVHTFGIPIDLHGISATIIEDCAQAIGASVAGVPVGLQNKAGIFSFYATKLMTSGGQGGMVVSHDKGLAEAVRDYREFDLRRDHRARFNFQMTDLQATIGRVQLQKLPEFLYRREEIFSCYRDAGIPLLGVDLPARTQPVRYRAVVTTSDPMRLIASLAAEKITAIVPVEKWELQDDAVAYPNATALTQGTVSLPIFPSMTDTEVKRVISACLRGIE